MVPLPGGPLPPTTSTPRVPGLGSGTFRSIRATGERSRLNEIIMQRKYKPSINATRKPPKQEAEGDI